MSNTFPSHVIILGSAGGVGREVVVVVVAGVVVGVGV